MLPLLLILASAAHAQDSYKADSLKALLGVQTALRLFESRWRTEIASQAPAPNVAPFAQCELRIRIDWCYGPNNGKVGYSPYGAIPNADRFARDVTPGLVRKKAKKLLTALLDTLKKSREIIPADQWIAGQLVRLNLERGDPKVALDEAMDCKSDRWWCDALRGHVLHLIGNMEEWADLLWTETLYHMPLEERCRWLDPTDVIKSDSLRRAVAAMDCARKVDFAERLWWLSDPLYLTRGNERRSEHLSRQVALLLDAFSNQRLDSARVDMIVRGQRQMRYEDDLLNGVPTAGLLPRDLPDITRTRVFAPSPLGYEEVVRRLGVPGYLQSTRPETGSPPQMVALFPNPRFSFVPSASTLLNPTSAPADGWKIVDDEQYEFQVTPDREFVDLDYQVAFFRRGDSARMVAAADMEGQPQLTRRGATAALYVRRDYTDSAELRARPIRTDLFIQAVDLPRGRTLVSMEILSRDSSWAGRVRFGAGLPAMPSQRVTLSDVMFVERRPRPPRDLEDAEHLMLGSTRLKKGSTLGLFWEMYGLVSGDSVHYAVKVTGERPGLLGMVGRAITGQPAQIQPRVEGVIPVVSTATVGAYALNLDLKTLSPGRYTLSVEVRVEGQQPVESVRAFEILVR